MANHVTQPAKSLFRVSYVDTVIRQAYILATDEDQANDIIEEQISNGIHHHAIDAYHDDMQAEPADESTRCCCFECGKSC
jgi:hypothetical protein